MKNKEMNKNLLLAVVSMFLCSISAFAQNTLNIHQKNGGVVSYAFSEKPVVTYADGGITLTTTHVDVYFPLSELVKFTFEDDQQGSTGILRTLGTSDDVLIYDTAGVLVHTAKETDGKTTFSTANLPAGTYIIKNGKTTYKIIKR